MVIVLRHYGAGRVRKPSTGRKASVAEAPRVAELFERRPIQAEEQKRSEVLVVSMGRFTPFGASSSNTMYTEAGFSVYMPAATRSSCAAKLEAEQDYFGAGYSASARFQALWNSGSQSFWWLAMPASLSTVFSSTASAVAAASPLPGIAGLHRPLKCHAQPVTGYLSHLPSTIACPANLHADLVSFKPSIAPEWNGRRMGVIMPAHQ